VATAATRRADTSVAAVMPPASAPAPAPSVAPLGSALATLGAKSAVLAGALTKTIGGGPAECRRTVYTGPGYNFRVGSGRQTSIHVVDDDGGQTVATVLVVNDTLCLFMQMNGKVTFTEDESDVASISPGGHLSVQRAKDGREQALEIAPDGRGGLTRRYTENGAEADPSAARAVLAELIPFVMREAAIDPNGRVARIRRKSGIAGVMREISLISSDGAKRKYYDALLTSGLVPADTLRLLAQTAARTISSDGDKSFVLRRIDEQREATPAVHAAVADAARTISSDGDKRRVLESAISRSGGAVPAYAVADIAGGISSDGDKAALLGQVADRYDGSDSLRTAFFEAVRTMTSDSDRSRVLLALLGRQRALDRASQVDLLRAARDMTSDDAKSRVLTAFVNEGAFADDAVRRAFFDVVNTFTSDDGRSRVLLAVVRRNALSAALTRDVLTATSPMTSDHSKGEVLTAIARANPLTDAPLRAQFIGVLKTMTSDSEYRQVMDQLMK
jgi:hypothetical protein